MTAVTLTRISTHADQSTIQPTQPKTKGTNTMSLNPEYVTAPKPQKTSVSGIGASNDPKRLIDVLVRLGLCSDGLATPLKQLAAAGKPVGEHFKVSVWDLDHKLAGVDCTLSQRMQLKASLDLAGLLAVPK
jgi:hypothetical protein